MDDPGAREFLVVNGHDQVFLRLGGVHQSQNHPLVRWRRTGCLQRDDADFSRGIARQFHQDFRFFRRQPLQIGRKVYAGAHGANIETGFGKCRICKTEKNQKQKRSKAQ